VHRIEGLSAGLYRYLPLEHALTLVRGVVDADAGEKILDEALMAHNFGAAVTFLWAAAPERSEWSYNFEAHRLMLLDAGHICQNLYLACEAVGCGTCAVGAYDQEKSDRFLGIDGTDRFLVYAAPVGKAI
jgi:SagB-type dehydrogenase family enzyme